MALKNKKFGILLIPLCATLLVTSGCDELEELEELGYEILKPAEVKETADDSRIRRYPTEEEDKQISQANNTQRASNVQTILNAVHQYGIDHRGELPEGIEETPNYIGSDDKEADITDLHDSLVPMYIAEMPYDPTYEHETHGESGYEGEDNYFTGYKIFRDEDGRVTVSAPNAEVDEEISVTR